MKMIKKLTIALLALVMMTASFVAFGADTAESYGIFDYEDLLDREDSQSITEELYEASRECGFGVYVLTASSFEGYSAEGYADRFFYTYGLGTGEDRDGVLLLLSMTEREVYIYTHGTAIRYLTDNAINHIFDRYDGGLIAELSDGDIKDAIEVFIGGTRYFYEEGIYQDQDNYDSDTGDRDYYYQKKNSISIFEIAISVIIAFFAAFLPIQSIKRKYAMRSEKALAQGFNLSYRANAVYEFTPTTDNLINKYVRSMPIPRVKNNDNNHHSGFGGGSSTIHMGMGGSSHGGGGRSF